ncbi:unnamed protein product [Meganyctiphanes norvegica]|uniref:ZSWIM3 N-terminal domain-containing protein n=1 Tax=Meganyctiphanes norvegica TaxID=48144 RepID=A0AAV2Q618_MEGNR
MVKLRVGSKFHTFDELSRCLDEFQKVEQVQLWARDSRTIVAAAKRTRRKSLNPALVYAERTYFCVFGGRNTTKTQTSTSASTGGCPFKVRLSTSLDGQALVVKEICHKHNHEPGKKLHQEPRHLYKKNTNRWYRGSAIIEEPEVVISDTRNMLQIPDPTVHTLDQNEVNILGISEDVEPDSQVQSKVVKTSIPVNVSTLDSEAGDNDYDENLVPMDSQWQLGLTNTNKLIQNYGKIQNRRDSQWHLGLTHANKLIHNYGKIQNQTDSNTSSLTNKQQSRFISDYNENSANHEKATEEGNEEKEYQVNHIIDYVNKQQQQIRLQLIQLLQQQHEQRQQIQQQQLQQQQMQQQQLRQQLAEAIQLDLSDHIGNLNHLRSPELSSSYNQLESLKHSIEQYPYLFPSSILHRLRSNSVIKSIPSSSSTLYVKQENSNLKEEPIYDVEEIDDPLAVDIEAQEINNVILPGVSAATKSAGYIPSVAPHFSSSPFLAKKEKRNLKDEPIEIVEEEVDDLLGVGFKTQELNSEIPLCLSSKTSPSVNIFSGSSATSSTLTSPSQLNKEKNILKDEPIDIVEEDIDDHLGVSINRGGNKIYISCLPT